MIVVLGLAVMAAVSFYIYALSRNVYLGWVSLLIVDLYNFTFGVSQSSFAGTNLDPIDVVCICLLIAGLLRTIPRFFQPNTARTVALAYFVIFAASLARGILTNGFKTAANESRGYVGFLIAALYFLTAPVDAASVQKYLKSYFYYGIGLIVVALLAYAGFHVGAEAWSHNADVDAGSAIDGRLLPSAAGAALALCFFLSQAWVSYTSRALRFRWLPAVTLGLAVFLRHRTVWAMLAAGIACFAFVDNRLFRRLIPLTVIAAFVIGALSFLSRETVSVDEDTFSNSSSNEGTWRWRVESWTGLLYDEDQTPLTIAFGKSMGSGAWRFDSGSGTYINAPPHSEYVAQYLRVGVVGVGILLWSFIGPLKRLWLLSSKNKLALEPSASAWAVVLVGILVYGVAYGIETDSYALLGIASAMVVGQEAGDRDPEICEDVDSLQADALVSLSS
jgi:hypothetical protein